MECELCGRVCECKPAVIDNVKMMLCPSCMKYGKGIKPVGEISTGANKPILPRIKRPKEKDVYKDMDKELVSNWNIIIKNAREKKGLSREQLGFNIGERTVTISKIENGELRPSDKVVEKLEKELKIKLLEEVSSAPSYSIGSHSGRGLTLGDFIKRKE
ncbi:MAG: TIGR00270 family protein [Thermoplasmata archaeon]|nr:MAG: TIGR00270 family protein [Thermoplasmata archaeon]